MRKIGKRILPVAVTVVLVVTIIVVVRNDFSRSGSTLPAAPLESSGAPSYKITSRLELSLDGAFGVALLNDGRIAVSGTNTVLITDMRGESQMRYAVSEPVRSIAVLDSDSLVLGMEKNIAVLYTDTGEIDEWSLIDERSIITSVAVSGAHVFAADAGTRKVWVFSKDGKLIDLIGGFIVPSPYFDVASGEGGSVYIVDPGRHTINHYDSDGERISSWGKYSAAIDGFGGCCNPTDIAVDAAGHVFTSEKGILRIKEYSADGGLISVAASAQNMPGYDAELDIAVDPLGRIVVLSPALSSLLVLEEAG